MFNINPNIKTIFIFSLITSLLNRSIQLFYYYVNRLNIYVFLDLNFVCPRENYTLRWYKEKEKKNLYMTQKKMPRKKFAIAINKRVSHKQIQIKMCVTHKKNWRNKKTYQEWVCVCVSKIGTFDTSKKMFELLIERSPQKKITRIRK